MSFFELQVAENSVERDDWNAFVRVHPHATFCHQYEWLKAVEQIYGGSAYYLTAHRRGHLVGVLPLMHRRVLGAGRVLTSVPFADEGGLLATCPGSEQVLLQATRELGATLRTAYVEFRQTSPLDAPLPHDGTRVTLKMALPDDAGELWDGLKGKVRNQIRKAQRCGLEACQNPATGQVMAEVFYPVYSRNTRDLGSPMHARRFFEVLTDAFPAQVAVASVALDGQTIGAAVALIHQHVFSVPWAGALRRYFDKCPNNLLYWQLMLMAIERGCTEFDFGRSAPGSGTYHFKRQWGAREIPLCYQYMPIRHEPRLGEKRDGAAYRIFAKTWQKTPLPLARALGPSLFRRLPI